MAIDAHKNFAYSTVLTAPSPANSGTSLVVQSGAGALFPAVPFNVTIWPAGANPLSTNAEIARVTAIATDTFTITRAQESSTARSVVVGDQISATITAKTLTDVEGPTEEFNPALYATLASPTFTGTPLAPTAAVNTNTTQIATTAFVLSNSERPLGNPATDGYILSSTVAGVRSWIAPGAGGGGDVTKVGTPANTEVAWWTGNGTLGRSSSLVYVSGDLINTGTMQVKSGNALVAWSNDNTAYAEFKMNNVYDLLITNGSSDIFFQASGRVAMLTYDTGTSAYVERIAASNTGIVTISNLAGSGAGYVAVSNTGVLSWAAGSGIIRIISNISTTTTGAAATLTDYVYLCTSTFTFTLPTAVSNTDRYTINNAGTGVITIVFTSGQNANGSTTLTLAADTSIDLISNNTNWRII